jgi:SAM-dependent methyltransferase
MTFERIPPPGTLCLFQAVLDMHSTFVPRVAGGHPRKFIEFGCGTGDLSKIFLEIGYFGICLDFSKSALEVAASNLGKYIREGRCQLLQCDAMESEALEGFRHFSDLSFSMMVMEHVQEDVIFIENLSRVTRVGGAVMLAVPGRKDLWGIEDDTVGHLRRYERYELREIMEAAGLENVVVWSVAVPTANILLRLGNFFVRQSAEKDKLSETHRYQTERSGVREVPFKTIFPKWFGYFLNRYALYPLFILQRVFYGTNLGLTLLAIGIVREGPGSERQ